MVKGHNHNEVEVIRGASGDAKSVQPKAFEEKWYRFDGQRPFQSRDGFSKAQIPWSCPPNITGRFI